MPVIAEAAKARKSARREVNEISDVIQEVENDVRNDVLIDSAAYRTQAARYTPEREQYSHYRGDLESAPKARSRFVGAHRHVPARDTQKVNKGTFTLASTAQEDVLIFQEFRAAALQATPLVMDEVVVEAARRRRRARAPHRAFRLSGTQMMLGGLLLAQLLMVLWLQSQSLALRNRDEVLRRDIAQTRDAIAQKKNEISQLDSQAHLNELASRMRWSKAPQQSFDKISDIARLTPQQAVALTSPSSSSLAGNRLAQAE